MSLPANKQAFLDQLRNYALVPQDPVHLDLFIELLDKYVAGLEESSGSNEPDPASPQEVFIAETVKDAVKAVNETGEAHIVEIAPLPSAADLDAVAAEANAAEATEAQPPAEEGSDVSK